MRQGMRLVKVWASALAIGAGIAVALPSSATAGLVIENNFPSGTGSLTITLQQGGITDTVSCTGSPFAGTVSSPPNTNATLSSWTWSGCTASSGGQSFGPATVTVQGSLPSITALSTNSVRLGTFTVRAQYTVSGSTCRADVMMGSWNYNYTSGASTNQLSASAPHTFAYPGGSVPPNCLSSGIGNFQPSLSLPDPQFEVSEKGQFQLRNTNSAGAADLSFLYGLPSDKPITGDWDGDGDTTIGTYRSSNRTFYLRNSNSAGAANHTFQYGLVSATPVIGDWDGDGDETVGLYDTSSDFALNNANDSSGADYYFNFGASGDVPVVGDWDGDGDDTIGVYRPSERTFYLKNSNAAGSPDYVFAYGLRVATPIVGDWDGDGDDTVGLYDIDHDFALNNQNDSSGADLYFEFGAGSDIPVVGDWDDDGDTTVGIFRP